MSVGFCWLNKWVGNLDFSILEAASIDMGQAELFALEDSWKERLHTRLFGLKRN